MSALLELSIVCLKTHVFVAVGGINENLKLNSPWFYHLSIYKIFIFVMRLSYYANPTFCHPFALHSPIHTTEWINIFHPTCLFWSLLRLSCDLRSVLISSPSISSFMVLISFRTLFLNAFFQIFPFQDLLSLVAGVALMSSIELNYQCCLLLLNRFISCSQPRKSVNRNSYSPMAMWFH